MPFTGGASPSPERYGGGVNNTNKPELQVVYESLAAQRGSAYDQAWPPASAVGAENMAHARAITFDLHGGNRRLANEFNPAKATVGGLLPRWEAILGTPPLPGDSQQVRQARVAAAFARLGVANGAAAVSQQLASVLGVLYGGITTFAPPDNALWPGVSGSAAALTAFPAGNLATVAGLANVPSSASGSLLTLSNCFYAANDGTWPVHNWISAASVKIANPNAVVTDYGVGGSIGSPTIVWSLSNPSEPWTSMVSQIDILALLPAGYYTVAGGQKVPTALWWQTVAQVGPVLDAMLPAWMTWQVYVNDSAGQPCFLLDEPNLDMEIFCQ